MNVFKILLKEFKQQARDKKANALMILLPIVLIFILSKAFSTSFSSTIELDDVNVLYSSEADSALEEAFVSFTDSVKSSLGIKFVKTTDKEKGISSVKEGFYACYIELKDGIEIYKNERYNFQANLIESLCKTFASRYDAMSEIAKSNPLVLEDILKDENMDYTELKSLDKKRTPSSLDYYAVSMLTLIMLYASMTGYSAIKTEQYLMTQGRIFASPVRKHEYLAGKILGCLSISVIQAILVFAFGKFLMNANWGNDIFTILLIITSECVMTVALGAGIALMVKNPGAGAASLNVVIPIMAFLGGGYVPVENLGSTLQAASKISPLKWTNDAIFRLIYDNDYSYAVIAIVINLVIAAIFITIAAIKTGKDLR